MLVLSVSGGFEFSGAIPQAMALKRQLREKSRAHTLPQLTSRYFPTIAQSPNQLANFALKNDVVVRACNACNT